MAIENYTQQSIILVRVRNKVLQSKENKILTFNVLSGLLRSAKLS